MKQWLLTICTLIALTVGAVEKIAVAELQVRGVEPAPFAAIPERLEERMGGKEIEVYTRTALTSLLKEIAFQQDSGLVADNRQLARLAEMHGVAKLLVPTIARTGSKYTLTLLLLDCSTGRIDSDRRASVEAPTPDALLHKLDGALAQMGLLRTVGGGESTTGDKRKTVAFFPVRVKSGSPEVGNQFGDMLQSFLLKSGSFSLLDRQNLQKLAAEYALGDTELADSASFAKLGKLQAGDFMIVTVIDRLEHRRLSSGTAIAGTSYRDLATVGIQLRLINSATGELIAVESLTVTQKSTDIPAAVRRDWTPQDYLNSLLEKAAVEAGNRIVDRLDPILIASVDGDTLYLTRGEGAGVKPGDVFEIFAPGKAIVHPRTKRILGSAGRLVGELKVSSVQPDFATAHRISGRDTIGEGAVCRRKSISAVENAAPTAPAYPMATP